MSLCISNKQFNRFSGITETLKTFWQVVFNTKLFATFISFASALIFDKIDENICPKIDSQTITPRFF